MYPIIRLRRNRRHNWLRELTAETKLLPEDLILPIFVIDGTCQKQEIKTMPGICRQSIDQVILTAKRAERAGIKAIALFSSIDVSLKSENGDEAYNQDNLICRTIKELKNSDISIGIICDVALDPYTTHGHDGIVVDGHVDNDKTIEALCKQAMVLARAGVDVIAPSDMMDGRILKIRQALDNEGFVNVNIISYAIKYNSSLYGPFRDAVVSNKNQYLCKAEYQMNISNVKEAMREIEQDIQEGADIIMVKPGMFFLDVITKAVENFDINIFAYQVSGEYAMIKFAAQNEVFKWEKAIVESLISFKRAGASSIFTYAALEVAELINKK